jgi:hypothetical protein
MLQTTIAELLQDIYVGCAGLYISPGATADVLTLSQADSFA